MSQRASTQTRRSPVPPRELGPRRSHGRQRAAVEHAEELVRLRLAAIRDTSLPMSDQLRAAEQLENRALGRPKETVEQQQAEPEELRLLREASDEELDRIIQAFQPQVGLQQLASCWPAPRNPACPGGSEGERMLCAHRQEDRIRPRGRRQRQVDGKGRVAPRRAHIARRSPPRGPAWPSVQECHRGAGELALAS
jgi:hypothetical protein